MSINLVAAVMQVLQPELVTKIAAALGIDRGAASKAVSAGVPAMLGGFARRAATAEGAADLGALLEAQAPDTLSQLGASLGGGAQAEVLQAGLKLLERVLGGPARDVLIGALGKYAGIDPQKMAGLVAIIAPIVTAILASYQRSGVANGGGAAKLLVAQQASIESALPTRFASQFAALPRDAAPVPQPVEVSGSLVSATAAAVASAAAAMPQPVVQAAAREALSVTSDVAAARIADAASPLEDAQRESREAARRASEKVEPAKEPAPTLSEKLATVQDATTAKPASAAAPAIAPARPAAVPAAEPRDHAAPKIAPAEKSVEVKTSIAPPPPPPAKIDDEAAPEEPMRERRRGVPVAAWILPLLFLIAGAGWWWQSSIEIERAAVAAEQARRLSEQQAADDARRKAEAEVAAKQRQLAEAEADARRQAEMAAARLKADADAAAAKMADDARRRAAADRAPIAAAQAAAEADAKRKTETEAAAKQAAEAAARQKVAADAARAAADAERRRKADAEAAAKAAADADAKRKAASEANSAPATAAVAASVATDKPRAEISACHKAVRDVAAAAKVKFGYASAAIQDEAPLIRVASSLRKCPAARVRVEGHSDSNGNINRNQELSEDRARTVAAFLVAAGVAADRVQAKGYGETRPIVLNDTESNRSRNRRIEIVVD